MSMYVDSRKNKNGTTTYRITYKDGNGKRRRLSPDKYPKFNSKAEADAWVLTQEATREARKARMARKLEWKNKFYNFVELEADFLKWHKRKAPNSWKSSRLYLTYVLEFFLNQKKDGNVNNWCLHHQAFRDWLEDEAKGSTKGGETLSYSTKNHVIRALNNFQAFLLAYNKIDREAVVTCECFPQHKVGKRSLEDVITPEEFDAVHKKLTSKDRDVADFFYVAYWTGMRFSEVWGLPIAYLYGSNLDPNDPLSKELKKHDMDHFGRIVLESQLDGKAIVRDGNTVLRKPLKTKKKISPKDARVIPILDKECRNILSRRHKEQKKLLEAQTYGMAKENYLLFDGLTMSRLNNTLREAYNSLGIEPKSYHCCRHSRATYLVGETRSYFLGKAMLGHKSDVHDDYVHIFEMIATKAKQQFEEFDEVS